MVTAHNSLISRVIWQKSYTDLLLKITFNYLSVNNYIRSSFYFVERKNWKPLKLEKDLWPSDLGHSLSEDQHQFSFYAP